MRWVEEIGLGLLGFCALANLTRGAQLDSAHRTALCLYFQVPFVYIGQFYQIHDRSPNPYIFLGMFLVLCAVVTPAIRKLRAMSHAREDGLKVEETLSARTRERLQQVNSEMLPLIGEGEPRYSC